MSLATATGKAAARLALPRWGMLLGYLAVLVLAEVLVAIPDAAAPNVYPYQQYGLTVHILLMFLLLFHAVLAQARDATLSALLVALSLGSLIRISNLAIPTFTFTILQKLAFVSVPLLIGIDAVAYVQKLRPVDLGLLIGPWPRPALQAAIAATGVPLGLVEYLILRPEPWIPFITFGGLVGGSIVIFAVSGMSEEVIFRGIMLKRAVEGLGPRMGLVFVTTVFASLHIFFLSATDLVFVFFVGLFYGLVVLRTKSLWGVILSHTLANVVLYLLAPFLLA